MMALPFPGRVFGKKVPLRATIFAWLAALGKILIENNIRKRHVIVIDWFCMCKRSGKSVDHRLIHCEVASALWRVIFSCVGLTWVMPRRIVDLFTCWRGLFGSPLSVAIWKMVPSCLL